MSSTDPPRYKSHPLYRLRRFLIINAAIGLLFHFIACISSYYAAVIWGLGIVLLAASGILSLCDLLIWNNQDDEEASRREPQGMICPCRLQNHQDTAHSLSSAAAVETSQSRSNVNDVPALAASRKKDDDHDDDKPKWPVYMIMVFDFLLSGAFFCWFILEMTAAGDYRYYSGGAYTIFRTYTTVPTLIAAIFHAKCWWREFRAREKQSWARELGLGRHGAYATYAADIERDMGRASSLVPGSAQSCPHSHHPLDISPFSTARQFGGTLLDAVHGLNNEAKKALASKRWLGPSYDIGHSQACERALLLPQAECRHGDNDINNVPHVDKKFRSLGACNHASPSMHGISRGNAKYSDKTSDGLIKDDGPSGRPSAESLTLNRSASYLTPSDSSVTSDSSGSDGNHGGRLHGPRKQTNQNTIDDHDTGTGNEEWPSSSHVQPNKLGKRTAANATKVETPTENRDHNVEYNENDEDIMVVRKPNKAKQRKEKKAKRRDFDLE